MKIIIFCGINVLCSVVIGTSHCNIVTIREPIDNKLSRLSIHNRRYIRTFNSGTKQGGSVESGILPPPQNVIDDMYLESKWNENTSFFTMMTF